MTSVTTSYTRTFSGSAQSVRPLRYWLRVEVHCEPLAGNVDGRHHVGVGRLGGDQETLAEDVETPVAADEADQVIAPASGLGKGTVGAVSCAGKRSGWPAAARAPSGVWPSSRV